MSKDTFPGAEVVASAHECTGLVPSLPLNDPAADDDLTRLYGVLPPKRRNGARKKGAAHTN